MTADAEKPYLPTISCPNTRGIDNVVLARAVRHPIEHRVLLNGNKTVVLR